MLSLATRLVTVVGGADTDIVGRSDAPLVAEDSNPGVVGFSAGGVGRNIAENLARIGARTTLLTAFGSDFYGRELERACRAARIDTTPSLICRDLPGSIYLALLDDTGDMALALSDMRALERITPRLLQARRTTLTEANLLVADTNLSDESLAWIATQTAVPLLIDLVSTTKAPRAQAVLGRSAVTIRGNAIEAAALVEWDAPADRAEVVAVSEQVRAAGAETAIITDGAEGAYISSAEWSGWIAAPEVEIANATGAGDAFTAGVAAGFLGERSVKESAELGARLAAIALTSISTVSEHVSPTVLKEVAR